jgi:3-oxoacyl-[acyl-carrier protein] reductase
MLSPVILGGVATPPAHRASSDPVAIITAASGGLGRHLTRELARRHWAIVVVYLCDQRAAEATVEEIRAVAATAVTIRADLTDELDVERLFAESNAAFGGVDVVVHTTIRGLALVNRRAARELRRGGAIVGTFSAHNMTRELTRQLHARRVTVHGVGPSAEPRDRDRDLREVLEVLDRWRRQWERSG